MMGRYLRILTTVMLINCFICFFSAYAPHLAYSSEFATGENEDITEVGDWVQIILPALAWTSTFVAGSPDGKRWDREGTAQATKAIGGAIATTTLWKGLAGKMRPNESNEYSFPSGHTTAAFAGAGFIDVRYGHFWGIPALLAAGFVGYSRVQAFAHFADDVTAGMSVGLMNNWIFTTPQSQSSNASVLPMMLGDGAGLQLTFKTGKTNSDEETKKAETGRPRARYTFSFGPAFLARNEISSPSSTGTTFDLNDFEKDQDPTTTAGVVFDIFLDDRNEIDIFWWPFESRDRGSFTSPVSFAGQIFPANTSIRSAWVQYTLNAGWRYNLIPSEPWDFKVGAGLSYQHTEVDLVTEDSSVVAAEQDWVLLPYVHASVGYQINPKWSAVLAGEGIYLADDQMLDAWIYANYQISTRWDAMLGYTYYLRDIETSELTNKVIYHGPWLGVSYSWLSK